MQVKEYENIDAGQIAMNLQPEEAWARRKSIMSD